MTTIARDNAFQYDSILEMELSRKWISVFRTRVRDRFYECKVVKLISIHAGSGGAVVSTPKATWRMMNWSLVILRGLGSIPNAGTSITTIASLWRDPQPGRVEYPSLFTGSSGDNHRPYQVRLKVHRSGSLEQSQWINHHVFTQSWKPAYRFIARGQGK